MFRLIPYHREASRILNRSFPGDIELACLYERDNRPANRPGAGDRRRGFSEQAEPWLLGQYWSPDNSLSAEQLVRESDHGVQAWQYAATDKDPQTLRDCIAAVGRSAAIDLNGVFAEAVTAFEAAPQTCVNANLDPYANALDTDELPDGDAIADQLSQILKLAEGDISHRVVACHGARFHASGASDATELAVMFATFVEWLRRFETLGLSPEDAAKRMVLRPAVSVDVVPTIAKLRALRAGLSSVCHHCGDAGATQFLRIHALPASRELSRTAPWVNSLRTTAMVFGAAVGGADAIFTATHDRSNTPTARRLARNTQLVLREECGLAQVTDPAGGSGQIEQHTDALLHGAWDHFQRIERAGGIANALRSGGVLDTVRAEADELKRAAATRKREITGVNIHPDPIGPTDPPAKDASGRGMQCAELRLSDAFDRLRVAGQRNPQSVHLHSLSASSMTAARVAFCRDVLAVAGIDAVVDASAADGIAILCGADEDYAACDASTIAALTEAGYARLYAAGAPPKSAERLASLGVQGTLRRGDDLVAFLSELQAMRAAQ
ncbi:MAG: methylmalonyl-CoA mutase family protein [Pseudomonadota bacterium]